MTKMSEKLTLLNDSSDSEIEWTVNKDYAGRYDQWREGKERQKYKDLLKDEEDSESSESEDFNGCFRALSLVKGEDPSLYDKNFQLFKKHAVKKANTEKQNPIYMKDYEMNLVLERDSKFSDEDEDVPEKITTYNEEQKKLKKCFKEAVDESDDSDVDELLQVKTKSKREEEHEEEDYIKWFKGEKKEIAKDLKQDMSHLKNYWNDPKLDEGEKYVRDYFLNKRYLEKDDSIFPSYEEITSGMLSDDEKTVEELDKFEHKYNHRFEEPDEEYIKRYPRTINDSDGKSFDEYREEYYKLDCEDIGDMPVKYKYRKVILNDFGLTVDEIFTYDPDGKSFDEYLDEYCKDDCEDFESDFDPDKHDQKMSEIFNNEYNEVEEEELPKFSF